MKLLPFGSFVANDDRIECPACLFLQETPGTEYCTRYHPEGLPAVDITSFNDMPLPHLHRTCLRCGYVWLEEIAAGLMGRQAADG